MIDSTLSPSETSSNATSDTVCNMTQPHHHHRHHHHLPQPQIIYVVANPQDLPIKAFPQNWPAIPAVAASMNQVNVSSNYHTPAPVPAPAPAPATAATVHTPSTPKAAQTQASFACTTIVDDCCVDCCPAAAAEETKQPSQPAYCSSPAEHHRPLPLPYAIRPAVSHHFQALRPIAPYPIPSTPPSTATPVASAISDFHRQHNVFSHQTPRLSTPQTQHGQRQQLGPRSVSAPTSPTTSTTSDRLSMTAPLTTQRRDQADPTENESSSVDQPDVVLEDSLQTEFEQNAGESVASSLATLSEAAVAASADKETWAAGHKRKLDEQQGEARCLWAACAAVFKCIDDLIPHLTKLHVASRSIKSTNQCRWETCQTEKEDSDELISHLCEEHLGAPELKHGCHWQGCDTRFESFDDLTGHLSERHIGTGKSQYFCSWDECERQGRAFTQRQKVMRHIQTHTGMYIPCA